MKTYTFGHWKTTKWPPDSAAGFTYTIRIWLGETMFIYHGMKTVNPPIGYSALGDSENWFWYTSSSKIVNWLYDDSDEDARFHFTINEWYNNRPTLRKAEQSLIKNETNLCLNGIGPDAVWLLINDGDWSCLEKCKDTTPETGQSVKLYTIAR